MTQVARGHHGKCRGKLRIVLRKTGMTFPWIRFRLFTKFLKDSSFCSEFSHGCYVVFNFFVPCLGEDVMIGLRKVSLSWWIICVFSATFLDFSWQRTKSWSPASSATEIPRTKTKNPGPRKRGLRFSHWDSTAEISHGYLDTQSRQILSVVFRRV